MNIRQSHNFALYGALFTFPQIWMAITVRESRFIWLIFILEMTIDSSI